MGLNIYTIYYHPIDLPEWIVVRPWIIAEPPGPLPGGIVCLCNSIDEARAGLIVMGLARIKSWI